MSNKQTNDLTELVTPVSNDELPIYDSTAGGELKKIKMSNLVTNSTIAYTWEGTWVTSTAYEVNDCVESGGNGYVCLEDHTSGTFATDLAAAKWSLLVQGINSDAWISYIPTVTAGAGTITTVAAQGYYKQIGKIVHYQVVIDITTNGTGSLYLKCTLPVLEKRAGFVGIGKEVNYTYKGVVADGNATSFMYITFSDGTYPGGNSYSIRMAGTYEAA